MGATHVIEQLGYKPNEARVYLAALGLGGTTVSDIATKLQLPRTSVQAIVDKLHDEGLMSFYVKRRYKYWTAESPERLLTGLKDKETALRTILPELEEMRRSDSGKPTIKVFSGAEEIKLIHDDIIATKHAILAFIPWDDWIALFGQEYVDRFIQRRVSHFLRIRLLAPRSDTTLAMHKNDAKELRITRLLPEHLDMRDTIFIYANKVAIVSLNKQLPTGVLIDDESTCRTMTAFFEDAWRQSATP